MTGLYSGGGPAGPMTDAERDASALINGATLGSTESKGNRIFTPPGLPRAQYDRDVLREEAAIAVIAAGGGALNRIADSYPMPDANWYRTNGLPANKALRAAHNVEKGSPPMGAHQAMTLWCKPCQTMGEEFLENLEATGQVMIPVVRGIAMAVSYIPVLGTAVSFVINATISLAEGEGFDEAMLDGIGGALPGQPASGAAFNVVRSIAKGERIDGILVAALPVSEDMKKVVLVGIKLFERIADGEPIGRVALDEIQRQLPPNGQKAMAYARRVADGENIGTMALKEIQGLGEAQIQPFIDAAKAAKAQGEAQYNSFLAQVGYQATMDTTPGDVREGVKAGLITNQVAYRASFRRDGSNGMRFNNAELDPKTLDDWAARGVALANSGAIYITSTAYHQPLSEIRANFSRGGNWTIKHKTRFDGLTGRTVQEDWTQTVPIDAPFRRGFDVGLGVCQGCSADGPGQQKIRVLLNNEHAKAGFDAAQRLQFDRTNQATLTKGLDAMAVLSLGRTLTAADRASITEFAAKGKLIAEEQPQVAAARALNSDGRFRWGFDIATGICQGMSLPGPGQTAWRNKLGPFSGASGPDGTSKGSTEAMQGFDVGQALQHGITKAGDRMTAMLAARPQEAAGMLIANGIMGSGSTSEVKVNAIQATGSNAAVRAGAEEAIKSAGVWKKILRFFGLSKD